MKTGLTDRGIAAIKVHGDGRRELADPALPGLTLRVSAKSRVFWYRYRRPSDGSQVRIKLGHYLPQHEAVGDAAAMTIAGARIRARKLRTQVDDGKDPAAAKRLARAESKAQPIKTLQDMADAFFAACASGEWRPRKKAKRASTIEGERYLFQKYVKDPLGDIRVEALTKDAVRKELRAIVARGRGITANRVRGLIRQIYAWGVKEGRVTTNPAAEFDDLVEEKPRERVLKDAEIKMLWAALVDPSELRKPTKDGKGEPVQVSRSIRITQQLALLTLQRRGEIGGMRVEQLDLEGRTWTIPAESTKAGRATVVPLSDWSVTLIREALELRPTDDTSFVFPGKRDPQNKPIDASAISHAFRDIRAAIEIGDITLHDLRRTGASLLAERAGVSPFVIGLLLNHSGERGGAAAVTLQVYVKADFMSEKRRAIEALEEIVRGVVG